MPVTLLNLGGPGGRTLGDIGGSPPGLPVQASDLPQITPLVARGSWYSQLPQYGWVDRGDRPNSNALGVPDPMQGIALPSRKTLGQYFDVTDPATGAVYRTQQTDVGPAPWTGRGVDISAALAHRMGYTPKTFPTDAQFTVTPSDSAPAGWQETVAAAPGYIPPGKVAQGATTNPDDLKPQEDQGPSFLARFMSALGNRPTKAVAVAAPPMPNYGAAFRLAQIGRGGVPPIGGYPRGG